MPAKIARLALNHHPGYRGDGSRPRRPPCLAERPEKGEYLRQ
jgi:hypothetical protein